MNRYKGKTARWQQQDKERQQMNKTEFIKMMHLRGKAAYQVKGGKHGAEVLGLLP